MTNTISITLNRIKSNLPCTEEELIEANEFVKSELCRQRRFEMVFTIIALIGIAIAVTVNIWRIYDI